jgi:hypothetical protein
MYLEVLLECGVAVARIIQKELIKQGSSLVFTFLT